MLPTSRPLTYDGARNAEDAFLDSRRPGCGTNVRWLGHRFSTELHLPARVGDTRLSRSKDFRKSGRMNDATSAGKMKHPEKRSKQSAPRQLSSFALRSRYEHFISLARAAASEDDRVAMENWYQHAEHYFRAMKEPTA